MILINIILISSILLQTISAFLVLRLIKITRHSVPWILLSSAVGLMAIRRMASLYNLWMEGSFASVNIAAEIIGLFISILVLIGILRIRPILNKLYSALINLENINNQLNKEVNQRKIAEKEAHKNEEQFRKLAESSPILIWMSNIEGKCNYFNEQWLYFRGRSMDQEKGMGWTEGLHHEDKSYAINTYLNAFKRRISFEMEYRMRDKNNEFHWLYDKGTPMYDKNSGFLGYIGSCIDITERKKVEKQREKSESKFRKLFSENNAINLIINSDNGQIMAANESARKFYRFENLESKNIKEINQLSEDEIQREMQYAYHKNKKHFHFRHKLASGEIRNVEVHSTPLELDGTKSLFTIVHDITDRLKAEEALRQSEEKFKKIVNNLPQFVAYTDKNLIYRFVNKTYLDRFNLKEEDIVGKSLLDIIGNESYNKAKPHIEKVLSGKRVHYKEYFRYPNGINSHMEGTLIPNFDQKGSLNGYYAVLSDITHHVQTQKLLEKSRNQLQKLSMHQQKLLEEERSYIAREIHDELGQNLTAIHMGLAFMKKYISRKDRQLFTKLQELNQLTQETLAKIKKLSTELRPQLIDDMGLLAAIEWHADNFEKSSNISCNTELLVKEEDIPKDMAIHIFRILQEGLINVYKHAEAHSVNITLIKKTYSIHLTITDDGKGIMEEDLNKNSSFGIQGIEERAKLMNGTCHIDGKNPGTTITIKIPLN